MKVVLFGKLPPPTGGVTKSVETLYTALKKNKHTVEIFSIKSLFSRFDIAHIHYSKSWKRLLGFFIGKIISKKVIFTLHGRIYKEDFFNNLNARLYNGAILLNNEAFKEYSNRFKKVEQISSLIFEGIENSIHEVKKYFEKKDNHKYVLLYSHSKIIENGYEIYGVDFILDNLNKISEKYKIILVDPQNHHSYVDSNEKIIHIDKEINFIDLLKEVDIYIRQTTKDGDSVAVQEALMMNVPVLASNIVPRPKEVVTYKLHNFESFIKNLESLELNKKIRYQPDSISKYLEFCEKI
jgi:hypothetical protein